MTNEAPYPQFWGNKIQSPPKLGDLGGLFCPPKLGDLGGLLCPPKLGDLGGCILAFGNLAFVTPNTKK